MSYFSIGQEQKTPSSAEPVQLEKQQISKVSRIDKRIKVVRPIEKNIPEEKIQEPAKKD